MTVAFDVSQSVYGTGVSDYVLNLTPHLPASSLTYFGLSFRRQADLKKLFPSAKILPFPPRFLHHLWNKLHIINVENLVGKFDVLHSSDWTQPPTKSKKVTTVHDLSAFLYPKELDPRLVRVQTARMHWVIKECDAIICVSQNTANDLQQLFNYPASKIHVIYEALPSRYLLTAQKSQYSNYIVTIGARQPRKNISRLIKSLSGLQEKLVVIGESTVSSLNPQVIYTGYVSDQQLVDILAGAKAFVSPSLYEGFGLPVLGAFHHRVPVAVSNTSSHPEVVGNAGIYFDPLDLGSITSGVSEAIKNRSKLIALGTKQLAKFNWATTATQTMQVYESLI